MVLLICIGVHYFCAHHLCA